MKPVIVITAFGTTSKAFEIYSRLDKKIRNHLPNEEILWAYSSPTIANKLKTGSFSDIKQPAEILRELSDKGVKKAIAQSLHLFPGTEFHNLCIITQKSEIDCRLGMPLFTSPQDYYDLADLLRPEIEKHKDTPFLILGHGTDHPSWTCYYSLEKILRRRYGDKIFVGVVEKYPDSNFLIDEIVATGHKEVTIFPLFLLTGMHYRRDIIGEGAHSWRSRFLEKKIQVTPIEHGVGSLEGIQKIIIRHIKEA